MEDPGGSDADALTSPPDVLMSAPPVNLTNSSTSGYKEENTAEIKFYLPVSARISPRVSSRGTNKVQPKSLRNGFNKSFGVSSILVEPPKKINKAGLWSFVLIGLKEVRSTESKCNFSP